MHYETEEIEDPNWKLVALFSFLLCFLAENGRKSACF